MSIQWRPAYSVKTAAEDTGLSQTAIRDLIHAGLLRAKRSNVTKDGEPAGKYVIEGAALKAYIEGLVDA